MRSAIMRECQDSNEIKNYMLNRRAFVGSEYLLNMDTLTAKSGSTHRSRKRRDGTRDYRRKGPILYWTGSLYRPVGIHFAVSPSVRLC